MEWILGVLILILGGAAIVVIYLSERINVFETLLGLNPKITSDKLADHVVFGPNPFGDLSGENLWKDMCGEEIEDTEIDISNVDLWRPRYELVIKRHIEMIVEDGRFDARAGERSAVKSSLRIPMLRGSVESFMPFTEASRLYEIGQEAESKPENVEKLVAEIDEIVDDLFKKAQLDRKGSVGRSLLPVLEDPSDEDDNSELEQPDPVNVQEQLALPSDTESPDVQKDPI